MNFLVFVDTRANELEKILSGTKSMIIKEFDQTRSAVESVSPGVSLYFLKNNDDHILRVKATVVRVLSSNQQTDEDLSAFLKEMQPRMQVTEDQYNDWAVKKQFLLVEFTGARKIDPIPIALDKLKDRSDWIAFEDFSFITNIKSIHCRPELP